MGPRHFLLEVDSTSKAAVKSQSPELRCKLLLSVHTLGLRDLHPSLNPHSHKRKRRYQFDLRDEEWVLGSLETLPEFTQFPSSVFSITPRLTLLVAEQLYLRCLSRVNSYRSALPQNVFTGC